MDNNQETFGIYSAFVKFMREQKTPNLQYVSDGFIVGHKETIFAGYWIPFLAGFNAAKQ